jgi:hypothetical protein
MSTHRIPSRARYPTAFEALLPWSPVLVGIGVVIGYLLWIVVLPGGEPPLTGSRDAGAVQQVPPPVPSAPAATPTPTPTPTPSDSPEPTDSPEPAPEPEPEPEPTEPPEPPPPDVVGDYKLAAKFDNEFIAKVVIVNNTDDAKDWKVRLDYSHDVGKLRAVWVDGSPDPAVHLDDGELVVVGAEPVGGDSHVVLKLNFERFGSDIDPTTCTVNGTHCT